MLKLSSELCQCFDVNAARDDSLVLFVGYDGYLACMLHVGSKLYCLYTWALIVSWKNVAR